MLPVQVRLPAAEVGRAAFVLLCVGLGAYLVWRIQEVLLLLFLAVLLGIAIEPIVNRLRRGPFNRGTGVLAVYTLIVLALGVPTFLLGPSLVSQAGVFVEGLPERLVALRPYAEQLQPRPLQEAAVGTIDRTAEALRSPAAPAGESLVQASATAAHAIVNFLMVFVLAFYWLVERPSIKRNLLRMVPPQRAREVNVVWMEVEEKLGGWVRGQLVLMLAVGVMAGVGFWFIGLPNPLLLAVLAGVLEMVPMLGPFLAFAPAVLVAVAVDPTKALVVLVYAVVIQQIEGNVLVPRVLGHTVGVSPLTVLLGILIGSALYGLPGAFLAVPVAGAVQVILAHVLRVEDPSQAEAHGTAPPPTDNQGNGASL